MQKFQPSLYNQQQSKTNNSKKSAMKEFINITYTYISMKTNWLEKGNQNLKCASNVLKVQEVFLQ